MIKVNGHTAGIKVIVSGAEILKGITNPSASDGKEGQLYLKYGDFSAYDLKGYIETGSTAGAYIDTGLVSTRDSYCEIKFKYNNTPTNNTWFFGAFSGVGIIIGYQNSGTDGYLQSGGQLVAYDTSDHVVEMKADGIYLDGVKKQTGNWSGVPVNVPLYLFSRGGDNPSINNTRIYYCKIWQNGQLARHLIPAVRKSDDEVGMVDVLNGTFYDNDGTQSFSAGGESPYVSVPVLEAYAKQNGVWRDLIGADVNKINSGEGGGDTALEYGTCCYIGTGSGFILPYTLNADYKVTVKFYEDAYVNDAAVIGNTSGSYYSHLTEYNSRWFTSCGSSETSFGSWVGQTEHTFINNNGNSKNEFDGVEVTDYTPTTDASYYYTIACRGSANSNRFYDYIKSYKIESISTGDVICELKPAKFTYQGITMKQGLLDIVNDVWYDNGTMVVSNDY